jgi:hypothetical protein
VRLVTQSRDVGNNFATHTLHETETFVADAGRLVLDAAVVEVLHLDDDHAQDIGVETSAEPLVGRYQNEPDGLHRIPFHQEGVLIFGQGMGQIGRNAPDLFAIGTGSPHPFLRLAHFGYGHHLHSLGDLARIFDALDLGANFLAASHGVLLDQAQLLLNA